MAQDNKGRPEGLFFNKPSDKAPDWVIGDINIPDKNKFIAWLQQQPNDRIRVDLCRWTDGSYYAKLNTYVPTTEQQVETPTPPAPPATTVDDIEDDLPF